MISKIQDGLDLIVEHLKKTTKHTGCDQMFTITTFTSGGTLMYLLHDTVHTAINTAEDLVEHLEDKRNKYMNTSLQTKKDELLYHQAKIAEIQRDIDFNEGR